MRTIQTELNTIWYFLSRLSSDLKRPPNSSTSTPIPNQPAPHLRSSTTNRPASWMGRIEPKEEDYFDSD